MSNSQIIHVRQKHIKKGIPYSCCSCPIALAVQEQTGKSYASTLLLKISRSSDQFMKKFDRGEKVKPFNFRLKWV